MHLLAAVTIIWTNTEYKEILDYCANYLFLILMKETDMKCCAFTYSCDFHLNKYWIQRNIGLLYKLYISECRFFSKKLIWNAVHLLTQLWLSSEQILNTKKYWIIISIIIIVQIIYFRFFSKKLIWNAVHLNCWFDFHQFLGAACLVDRGFIFLKIVVSWCMFNAVVHKLPVNWISNPKYNLFFFSWPSW